MLQSRSRSSNKIKYASAARRLGRRGTLIKPATITLQLEQAAPERDQRLQTMRLNDLRYIKQLLIVNRL